MRIIFFGTPELSVPFLKALDQDADIEVVKVVTQPDKPTGRHQILTPSPVKQTATTLNIPCIQPVKLRDEKFLQSLRDDQVHAFVVVAYGKLLPKSLLEIPSKGCINMHPSLLPRHRGPSPLNFAILKGDKETGISIMLLDEGMDTGPILAQEKFDLDDDETAETLTRKITEKGPTLLVESLKNYLNGNIQPEPQTTDNISVTKILERADGRIDWIQPVETIDRQIRALSPWPGTWTTFKKDEKELRLKITKATTREVANLKPGEVQVAADRLLVGTGSSILELLEIQPEGSSAMTTSAFLRGNPEIDGSFLV